MAQTVKIDTARLERDCSQFESGIRELEKCLQEMKESLSSMALKGEPSAENETETQD